MSEQPPTGEEPTRIGNGLQPPAGPPAEQPGGWTPPPAQQAPQWGPPAGQQQPGPYGQNPGQPQPSQPQPGPYGQQPGQYGQPQQWGPPQQGNPNPYDYAQGAPGGYGPPGGPGAPGGNWTPMGGGQPPRKSRTGLIVAAVVALVVLIAGGSTAAVLLTGDDDKDDSASEKSSQSTEEPTEGESEGTDEPTEGTEEPTEEPTESTDPGTSGEPFTPTNLFEVSEVCMGKAMTGATPFDKATAKVAGFANTPMDPDYGRNISIGYDQPWDVEYDQFAEITMVACVDGTPSTTVQSLNCEAEVKGKKTKYTYAPYDYTVVFREAATGQIIHEAGALPPAGDDCPMFAFIVDGSYTPSADTTEITNRVKEFLLP